MKPNKTVFDTGDTVTLSCSASVPTKTAYVIKWYKKGLVGELKSEKRYDVTGMEKSRLLTLKLTEKDDGEYRCDLVRRAVNYKKSTTIKIFVQGINYDCLYYVDHVQLNGIC